MSDKRIIGDLVKALLKLPQDAEYILCIFGHVDVYPETQLKIKKVNVRHGDSTKNKEAYLIMNDNYHPGNGYGLDEVSNGSPQWADKD
jgi:hypothetical protein